MSQNHFDSTGKALLEYWSGIIEDRLMNENTARAMKATCTQVLSAVDNWQTLDLRRIDPDEVFVSFVLKRGTDFTAGSLQTYRSRFAKAVRLFLTYGEKVANAADQINANVRQRRTDNTAKVTIVSRFGSERPAQGFVDYPFPLRDGRMALLKLPVDLKMSDVHRLAAFLSSLAVDFEPERAGDAQ